MTSSPHPITIRRLAAASALACVVGLTGCAQQLHELGIGGPRLTTPEPPPIPKAGPAVPDSAHVVLQNDQQVVAMTSAGQMKIEAGPGLRRVFDWDGLRRGAIVKPRDTPFANGETAGLTFDGTPETWADAHGISRLRYEEGERHFENKDDALIWMQIRRLYYVYNDDGLVLGWKRAGDTLHVELWQFYIDGQKPSSMPGSKDSNITEGKLVVEPQKMSKQYVFADGHTEPYNAETRARYEHHGAAKQAKNSNCNFFERLFNKCPPPAPVETTPPPQPAPPKPAPAENTPPPKPPEPELPKATITGKVVNIRSKPTTKSDVLMQAKKGDSVEIVKSENKWSYVQFPDGKKGWVADFLLDKK